VTTYATRLTKIGLVVVVAEVFGRICRFLPSRPNRCSCYLAISGVTGPNVTKIVHNVEKLFYLIFCNWNCDIAIRFEMAA